MLKNYYFCRTMILISSCILFSIILFHPANSTAAKNRPMIYVAFFNHLESSPIKGVPGITQQTPYDGSPISTYSDHVKNMVETCERYNVKVEFAFTPIVALILADDYPEVIERVKKLKPPIARYPALAAHFLPPPTANLWSIPGCEWATYGFYDMSKEDAVRQAWISETRSMVPPWHKENGKIIYGNPLTGTPLTLDQLPDYNIPQNEHWLYGGNLAIAKIFGIIPMRIFEPMFKNEQTNRAHTTVQKVLGGGAFPLSHYDEEINKPGPFGGSMQQLRWYLDNWPMEKPVLVTFGNNYPPRLGESIEYFQNRPEDFKIVWSDPEAYQWKPEYSALEYFKQTFGVSSLEEIRTMATPIEKILSVASPNDFRHTSELPGYDPDNDDWTKRLQPNELVSLYKVFDVLPDFLNPKEEIVRRSEIEEAASFIINNTRFQGSGKGTLPTTVRTKDQEWSLTKTFASFTEYLNQMVLTEVPPASVKIRDILGPVDYSFINVKYPGRTRIPPSDWADDAVYNEIDILHTAYEVANMIKANDQIPGKIAAYVGSKQRWQSGGRLTTVNAGEFLYGMAGEIDLISKVGLPWYVPAKHILMPGDSPSAWVTYCIWNHGREKSQRTCTISKSQLQSLSVSMLNSWGRFAGHHEDYGGPLYFYTSGDGENFSVSEVFQAFAFSLKEFQDSGSLPDKITSAEILGPIDYPMYDLRSPIMMDAKKFRGGWLPAELPLEDFPEPSILELQGLPAQQHGGYRGQNDPENIFEAVQFATNHIKEKAYIPGVIPIQLRAQGPRAMQSTQAYCNPAELLYTMAHLYWQIDTKGSPQPVIMGTTRIINDQNHLFVVVSSPVLFTRSTYRFRRQSFDWIEKIPVLRIHSSWTYKP